MRDMDCKREYDRQRMARLHAARETWWHRNYELRPYYDQARSLGNYLVRLCERSIGTQARLAYLTEGSAAIGCIYSVGPDLLDSRPWLERAERDRAKRLEDGRTFMRERHQKLAYAPCERCGEMAVAGTNLCPRFAIHDRCRREWFAVLDAERKARQQRTGDA